MLPPNSTHAGKKDKNIFLNYLMNYPIDKYKHSKKVYN